MCENISIGFYVWLCFWLSCELDSSESLQIILAAAMLTQSQQLMA